MRAYVCVVLLSALAFVVGCGGGAPPSLPSAKKHDDHGHPAKGPNGGALIELGDEEYHAELVVNEKSDEVTIYLLDKAAKAAVPVAAAEIVINLKHDGKPEQHKLAASPLPTDAQGKSSRFVSKDAELHHDLEEESADARLQVSIEGKAYSGKIVHEHDEKDHKHKH